MSLNDALSIAMSGLRANQAAMALVSSNVANAETPGYVRKTLNRSQRTPAMSAAAFRSSGSIANSTIISRRSCAPKHPAHPTRRCDRVFCSSCRPIYGNPDSTGTLENSFSGLTNAVQALSTSPDSQSARIGVVNAANVVAQQLNSMTTGIQTLRGAAEDGIKDSVNSANGLMQQIATINNQLQVNPLGGTSTDSSTAALLDQRDQYITQLSQLMDIRVTANGANQVTIFTNSGVQLVGAPGGDTGVQCAGHGDAQHAVQFRSGEEQSWRHHGSIP